MNRFVLFALLACILALASVSEAKALRGRHNHDIDDDEDLPTTKAVSKHESGRAGKIAIEIAKKGGEIAYGVGKNKACDKIKGDYRDIQRTCRNAETDADREACRTTMERYEAAIRVCRTPAKKGRL